MKYYCGQGGQYAGIISGHITGGALLKCAKAGKSDGQAATQQPMLCPAIT
jgi:hypothetical protein